MPPNQRYVIYYGWLTSASSSGPNDLARTIADARPNVLVAAFYTLAPRFMNLNPQVRELLHGAGVRIFAYVATGHGARDLKGMQTEVEEYLANDVEGIFFDEVYDFADDAKTGYYLNLSTLVRSWGREVIMNTGVAHTCEPIMSVADILMVEHQWRAFYRHSPWLTRYPPERFMAVSSGEPRAFENHAYVWDLDNAIQETLDAWSHQIGWHYSTVHYTELPAWFLDYMRAIDQMTTDDRRPTTDERPTMNDERPMMNDER